MRPSPQYKFHPSSHTPDPSHDPAQKGEER